MCIPTKCAHMFLYQVLLKTKQSQKPLVEFPIEIIDEDSTFEDLIECIVNVDTTIFISRELAEKEHVETGDVICFSQKDVVLRESETNPLYSYVIIRKFSVLTKALPENIKEKIDEITDAKPPENQQTFLSEESQSFDESLFDQEKPVQITIPPRNPVKKQQTFLTSSSDDDMFDINFIKEKSVHMTEVAKTHADMQDEKQDNRSNLRADLDRLRDNWGIEFIRNIPDPEPASDSIPGLSELLDSPETFFTEYPGGKTINISCQVSLMRVYAPNKDNQPYNFTILDGDRKPAHLAIFPKYNAYLLKLLLNILKEHNQSIILLQGNFVLSAYHANGNTRANLRPGKGVNIRYIRERPITDIKPEDFTNFIEYLFCADCPKHTPKDGILFYAGAYSYRQGGKFGTKSLCKFHIDDDFYKGILVISNDFSFIAGEYYVFHGLFKVDKNTSYLVMYTNDDSSQSKDYNIQKLNRKSNNHLIEQELCDLTLRPVPYGGSVEELSCKLEEVWIIPEIRCSLPYCGQLITWTSNLVNDKCVCEVNHREELDFSNIILKFKFNDTRPLFEVRLNQTYAQNLFGENGSLLINMREVIYRIAQTQSPGVKLTDSGKQLLDEIIQKLQVDLANHIGDRFVKLQVAYRPGDNNPMISGDYSKYFINNIEYFD